MRTDSSFLSECRPIFSLKMRVNNWSTRFCFSSYIKTLVKVLYWDCSQPIKPSRAMALASKKLVLCKVDTSNTIFISTQPHHLLTCCNSYKVLVHMYHREKIRPRRMVSSYEPKVRKWTCIQFEQIWKSELMKWLVFCIHRLDLYCKW